MKQTLVSAVIAVVVFTLLLGVAYPLAVTGISQVLFPDKADGSQIVRDAKLVGSRLIAQPVKGPQWFHPRPSQTDYDPSATFFSNRGPNQKSAKAFYEEQLAAYLKREGPYNPGLGKSDVPVDAVTTSGSGVDPHISEDNARIQARRVAEVRGLSLDRVDQLIDDNTDGRFLGLIGEPGVNVTELNLALDTEAR